MHRNLMLRLVVSGVFLWLPSEIEADVVFSLGEAIAAPGETEVTIPVSIELDPTEDEVRAWLDNWASA